MVFIVAYDLRGPNDTPGDYERVIGQIKTNFNWCHLEKSVWLIESALNAVEIREKLKSAIYATDVLFVARLEGSWASWALGNVRNNWLQSHSF